ncbi:LPS O-antigen chain length determinant protein WzzB [Aestuariirhabdus litorea]|nr:Wzz/FepE/Etk N-terminal domain-containing protein [Aestuariirhabdus litorea]
MSQTTPHPPITQYPQAAYPPMMGDEIDLIELFNKIWQRKFWVVGITALISSLALVYLMVAKPVYEAEVYLMPPAAADIEGLNIETSAFKNQAKIEDVYDQFLKNAQSRSLQLEYFRENGYAEFYGGADTSEQKAFEQFKKSLAVNVPKKGEVVFTSIALQGPTPEQVQAGINGYLDQVVRVTQNALVEDLNGAIAQKVRLLEDSISSKRKLAETLRQDRIVQLREVLPVAKASGIVRPGVGNAEGVSNQNISILNNDLLFMRGTEALEAEIKVLTERVSDDPFISGLRSLQEAKENLLAVKLDASMIFPVSIDQPATLPEKPIKPKKLLILAASIVLGGMLGLFVALVVPARKEEVAG